jgi:L-ascorbate metabolism protein UlaG (beta-lactamase superfamily)
MKKLVLWLAAALALGAPPAFAQGSGKMELLWLGQSCFRITTPGGKVIVVDPWLINNPKTPAAYKDLDALGKVDLILVTHAHGDHFADAPALAKKNNAPVWGPAGLGSTLAALGILPVELAPRMGKGGTIAPWGAAGVKITATHAEHSSELVWKNAEGKDQVYVGGEPVGYIIELENGFRIYHMGDTGLFTDMKFIGEHYKPDLLLVPVGGHFVMDPKDAAFATREWIKPKYAMPMHYGTNPYLKGTPEEYVKALGTSSVKVFQMAPGDKIEF